MASRKSPKTDAMMFSARSWHLAITPEDEVVTKFEFALMQVDEAYQRFAVHIARLAAQHEDPTFNEIVILHLVRMHDRPKDAATIATLLNRDDLPNVLYTLRKLASSGLVAREKVGTAAVFRATQAGVDLCDQYAGLRADLLLDSIRQVSELQRQMIEATRCLQLMAGIYDAGARTASTLNPAAVRPD